MDKHGSYCVARAYVQPTPLALPTLRSPIREPQPIPCAAPLRTVDDHFRGNAPELRALFDAVVACVKAYHVHAFRLTQLSDIDAEFREWLAEAYVVGQQRHLADPRKKG